MPDGEGIICKNEYDNGGLREIKDLTIEDIRTHCMFEIVIFVDNGEEEAESKIFCKAWRKTIQPLSSLDTSSYPRKQTRGGEWTIQLDTYGWVSRGWNTSIKENRSDSVALKDLNLMLGIRNQYPGSKIFLFSQGYPDWEVDREYCSFEREMRNPPAAVFGRQQEFCKRSMNELY